MILGRYSHICIDEILMKYHENWCLSNGLYSHVFLDMGASLKGLPRLFGLLWPNIHVNKKSLPEKLSS